MNDCVSFVRRGLYCCDAVCSSTSLDEQCSCVVPGGLDEVAKELVDLLRAPLQRDENVAALIMGMRGSGKSVLLAHAMHQVSVLLEELKRFRGLPVYDAVNV